MNFAWLYFTAVALGNLYLLRRNTQLTVTVWRQQRALQRLTHDLEQRQHTVSSNAPQGLAARLDSNLRN